MRQPAEWEPHAACWLAWPSAANLWGPHLRPAQRAFVGMCTAIAASDGEVASGERLHVLVPDKERAAEAAAALAGLTPTLHEIPFGDIWMRDIAPIFVLGPSGVAATTFSFNGWGGKYVLPGDAAVATCVAEAAHVPERRFPWVLEGGAVEVDGEGTCLTTRQCLLNPNRNPGKDDRALEDALAQALGVRHVVWLSRGLVNDHTDGHIDTLARFCAPGVVACMEARGTGDPNADALGEIATELAGATDARGRRLEVVRIPSPGRIVSPAGEVMPASYMNFYIANRTVIIPTYASRWDDAAVEAIAGLFPGRRPVAVDARDVLSGGGAIHCITQQQPHAPGGTTR